MLKLAPFKETPEMAGEPRGLSVPAAAARPVPSLFCLCCRGNGTEQRTCRGSVQTHTHTYIVYNCCVELQCFQVCRVAGVNVDMTVIPMRWMTLRRFDTPPTIASISNTVKPFAHMIQFGTMRFMIFESNFAQHNVIQFSVNWIAWILAWHQKFTRPPWLNSTILFSSFLVKNVFNAWLISFT